MKWNEKTKPLIIAGAIALGLVIAAGLIIFHKTSTKQTSTTASNFNTISDSSTGLSFNMSNRFEPIPKEELAGMNPGFTYGFKPAKDPNASCIVSQSKLAAGGTITSDSLRDGLLQEVKKTHPDVTLDNASTASNAVKFGDAKGVLLELTYTDGTTKIKRVEIIALGKAFQLIAYCQSASADNPKYYDDFTTFLSSLKLTK